MYFLSSCYMILKKNMLAYIYAFFFILFQQSLHTISLERGLFFMYYLLDETQEAYISYMHVFNLQRFERERVYTGNELFNKSMHLSAVNLHDWCPSTISTPKISHVTENGQWLGVNKKGNHTSHIGSFESKWKEKKNSYSLKRNLYNDHSIQRSFFCGVRSWLVHLRIWGYEQMKWVSEIPFHTLLTLVSLVLATSRRTQIYSS